jgi:hypothetical protein
MLNVDELKRLVGSCLILSSTMLFIFSIVLGFIVITGKIFGYNFTISWYDYYVAANVYVITFLVGVFFFGWGGGYKLSSKTFKKFIVNKKEGNW